MGKIQHLVMVVMIVCSFGVYGCLDSSGSSQSELDEKRDQWNLTKPDAYELTYFSICECAPYETRAIIENDVVVSARIKNSVSDDEYQDVTADNLETVFSVEDFFDEIEENAETADYVMVEYDEAYGYPAIIEIDPVTETCDEYGSCVVVTDDETTFMIYLTAL